MQTDASAGSRDRSPLHGEMDGVPGKSESSDVLPPPLPVSSPQPVAEQKSHRDDEGRGADEAGRDCKRARTQQAAATMQQSASESEDAGGMTEEEATAARQVCDLADVHKQDGDMEAEEHATVHACISVWRLLHMHACWVALARAHRRCQVRVDRCMLGNMFHVLRDAAKSTELLDAVPYARHTYELLACISVYLLACRALGN